MGFDVHVLFVDEFGHEQPYSPNSLSDSYNPVFGYGGFAMPARNLSGFATHFFDIKAIALRNVLLGKSDALRKYRDRISSDDKSKLERYAEYILTLKHEQLFTDPVMRQLAAKYEIKGDEIFARSYADKLLRLKREGRIGINSQIRAFFNFVHYFINILRVHQGEVFFVGVDKKRIHAKDFQNPHVRFIKEVVNKAHDVAQFHNTTVSIYMDRHHTDEWVKDPTSGNMRKGRLARAREIILSQKYYERITEPVVMHKSEYSQCTQAADWISYLLAQTLPYRCDKKQWKKYGYFHDHVASELYRNTSIVSEFLCVGKPFHGEKMQGELPLELPIVQPPGIRVRPYNKISEADVTDATGHWPTQ